MKGLQSKAKKAKADADGAAEPRLKQRVVLGEMEVLLLEKYKMLEETGTRRAAAVQTDDRAKMKAALVAQAAEREKALAEQRARQREAARRKKVESGAGTELATAVGGVKRVAEEGLAAGAPGGGAGGAGEKKARPLAPKEWDAANPGFPFEGMQLMETAVDLVRNPHLAQNEVGFFSVPLSKLPVRLDAGMGRKKYAWVPKNKRSTLHVGVRKLLMQEIEFLNKFGEKGMLVVYAGAAPGQHIKVLAELFPDLIFLLLDSAPFRCEATDKLMIWQQSDPYSENVLMEVRARRERKLFISDMHTGGSSDRPEVVDQYVAADMEKQMEWHQRLAPEASLLKFRLPWEEGTSAYLDGELFFSCFGPQTTTETRLLVLPKGQGRLRDYDHKAYEEQMFYFNRMVRVQYYEHDVVSPDLDHCFDCARTVQILSDYLITNSHGIAGARDAVTNQLMEPIAEGELAKEVASRHEAITKALAFQKINPQQLQEQQMQQRMQQQQRETEQKSVADREREAEEAADKAKQSPIRSGGAAEEEAPEYDMLLDDDTMK